MIPRSGKSPEVDIWEMSWEIRWQEWSDSLTSPEADECLLSAGG